MRIALYGRLTKKTNLEVLRDFFDYLRGEGIQFCVHTDYAQALGNVLPKGTDCFDQKNGLDGCDFLYSIGGDGTILDAVRTVGLRGIPVLGVNAGRLGFLASVSQYELQLATADLLRNAWKLDKRAMLTIEAQPGPIFDGQNFGLNEVTIHKANTNEMITVHCYINGEFMNAYWTDGLIISTPTGSTAYSLACGGPIISPRSGTFVITPIAPHSLTVRPIVIDDESVVSLGIESRSGQALVAIDNQTQLVPETIELAVRKADFTANLVKLPSRSYFSTLRNRLNWGLDNRN